MRIEKTLKQEEINALKTNPEYIELVARKNLGLVHASEFIYYLPPSEKSFITKIINLKKALKAINGLVSKFHIFF